MRNLLDLTDLTSGEIARVFEISREIKEKFERGEREPLLPGRVMALLFQKPSLRTRVSFEAGMTHLGGTSLFLGEDVGWGSREAIDDFGRVLSSYVDVIVVRAKSHRDVVELAEHCDCPVINGLTDLAHPCQGLADLFTLWELVGPLAGRKLAFVGDGNNVARTLAHGCGRTGMEFALAGPTAYHFDAAFVADLRRESPQLKLTLTTDPAMALKDASAVYTDVWTSMGQEAESERRRRDFADYQVNERMLRFAPREAYFMHCLPARRGEEVTDEVMDGPRSIVVAQAANRMHAQKGILAWLLGAKA